MFVAYGYTFDKEQKKLVVNREIFAMCMEGMGPTVIAKKLTERGILSPSGYEYQAKGRLTCQAADDEARNADRFLRIARKYEDLRELTPTILRELTEKTVVFEREKVDGKKGRQKIQIYYNFIGRIDLSHNNETAESA